MDERAELGHEEEQQGQDAQREAAEQGEAQCDAHLVDDKAAAQCLADRAVALQVDHGSHRPGRGLPLGEHDPHALAGGRWGVRGPGWLRARARRCDG